MPLVVDPQRALLIERLGVKPLPEDLLNESLTHSSYLNESDPGVPSNERLEFLGDAVLGFVIAAELFNAFPDAGEGALTRMRAELVRGSTLARLSERLGLGTHMVLGKGEEAAGGRTRDKNLAGVLEALIGAVYKAHGLRHTRALIRRLLRMELEQIFRDGAQLDAKSRLQQVVQAQWRQPPEYVTVGASPGDHAKFVATVRVAGTELGHGAGPTKRAAQQEAARAALARLSAELSEG